MKPIGVAIIGAGAIALANHLPGLALCADRAKLVALCDADPATLQRAAAETGVSATFTDYRALLADDRVDAAIIATPNHLHEPIVLAAAAAAKHVLCEKPIALDLAGALRMLRACDGAGVRHMTAFTYRFVPAMRYMKHLVDRGDVGTVLHFRAQRFQDWGDRPLGWRQRRDMAGTGEMGDMLSHRIDYAHHLVGPIARLVADVRTFVPTRGGAPSDVDDWVAMLAEFGAIRTSDDNRTSDRAPASLADDTTAPGQAAPPSRAVPGDPQRAATGVFESTKLATGRGEGHRGQDVVEVNGADGTIVYSTQRPLELLVGRRGDADLSRVDVPREFLTWPGSPRDPAQGDPLATFRYDQDVEFIDAILDQRPCQPSLRDGAAVQAVMDAALLSAQERRWVDVEPID